MFLGFMKFWVGIFYFRLFEYFKGVGYFFGEENKFLGYFMIIFKFIFSGFEKLISFFRSKFIGFIWFL